LLTVRRIYFIQIKLKKKKKKDMINMKVVYCCIKPPKENKGKGGINKLLIQKEHLKNYHMARVARKTGET
jgi:hypothetical protein